MKHLLLAIATALTAVTAAAQVEVVHPGPMLDPSRAVQHVRTVGSFHQPLPEQYVWTANDATVATGEKQLSQLKRDDWHVASHHFRARFNVTAKPAIATLYIAGPRAAKVWLNGTQVADFHYSAAHHMSFGTMTADVSAALKPGQNVIAIEAIRGYGSHHHTNALYTSWLNSGEVLTAKILPVAQDVEASPLLITDGKWKSTIEAKEGWQQPTFDDTNWQPVVSLGGIESSIDFFQWNADAGLYNWPGYLGEAPYMANYLMEAPQTQRTETGVLLDFGRELNGRILIQAGDSAAKARVKVGESVGELVNAPYLGEIELTAPPHTEARGPKTGFRYALVNVVDDAFPIKFLAEGIYYPTPQIGTFESSDSLVNKIFETAVYTAHLSMQDSILDGIKRDRGRWIGDDEVINRVVADVYGDSRLIKEGLEDAIGPDPVTEHVNGLPGYSAWWVISESEYIKRFGDLDQLNTIKPRLLQLLARMEKELDDRHVYVNTTHGKPFVDWSKDFTADSPEARRAVHFEYLLAFRKASNLFALLHDDKNRDRYKSLADTMAEAASKYLEDPDGSFGDRWQTNAISYLADIRWPLKVPDTSVVWPILKRTTSGRKPTDIITPYFGSYLLQAMSRIAGGYEALQWMKSYWGGMLDNGATSFWEAWNPAWAGDDPHAKLQADDKVGYNASLSHGWSSGPAAWLLETILGVTATEPGYKSVQVHPDLAGLEWAKGAIATPLGPVKVEASAKRILVEIPNGMRNGVLLPMGNWTRNGVKVDFGARLEGDSVTLLGNGESLVNSNHGGRFEFLKQ